MGIGKYGQTPTMDKCLASFVYTCIYTIYTGKCEESESMDKYDLTNLFVLPGVYGKKNFRIEKRVKVLELWIHS